MLSGAGRMMAGVTGGRTAGLALMAMTVVRRVARRGVLSQLLRGLCRAWPGGRGAGRGDTAVAERLGHTRLATLNHRDFTVVRPRHAAAFTLLPG
jgi:hypothetical protein